MGDTNYFLEELQGYVFDIFEQHFGQLSVNFPDTVSMKDMFSRLRQLATSYA